MADCTSNAGKSERLHVSDVILTIGGRDYAMACAAGEEAHIAELGEMLNDKLRLLPAGTGQKDSRSLLFAALLLADELFELRKSAKAQLPPTELAPGQLHDVAVRLEALADALAYQDA